MLLQRDYVTHIASEVVKKLVEGGHIETKSPKPSPSAFVSA